MNSLIYWVLTATFIMTTPSGYEFYFDARMPDREFETKEACLEVGREYLSDGHGIIWTTRPKVYCTSHIHDCNKCTVDEYGMPMTCTAMACPRHKSETFEVKP